MAAACGLTYDTLAWTNEWYLREDTLRAADAAIVNYHHGLPMAQTWGGGTMSSSDGQRFPMKGKSLTARALSRYFVNEGISTYTHVSDQHSTYGTKIISVTDREAVYVLDEILGNSTDLPISEHATDTAGQTLTVFSLFKLTGLALSPRIRDLGGITLHRLGSRKDLLGRFPHAGRLLTGTVDHRLIREAVGRDAALVGQPEVWAHDRVARGRQAARPPPAGRHWRRRWWSTAASSAPCTRCGI